MKTGAYQVVQLWSCDVCHVAKFKTFEEACRHEDQCRLSSSTRTNNKNSKNNSVEPIDTTIETTIDTTVSPSNTPFSSSTPVTPTPPSTSESKTATAATTATTTATAKSSQPPKKKANNSTSTSKPANSFFAPRTSTKRPSPTSSIATSTPNMSTTSNPSKRSKTPSTSTTSTTTSAVASFTTSASHAPKTSMSQHSITLSPPPITVASAPETALALAKRIDAQVERTQKLTKPIADFFTKPSSKLVAEQRQAMFQAKQRQRQQQERERLERQKKRPNSVATSSSSTGVVPAGMAALPPLPPYLRFPVPTLVPTELAPLESTCSSSSSTTTTTRCSLQSVVKPSTIFQTATATSTTPTNPLLDTFAAVTPETTSTSTSSSTTRKEASSGSLSSYAHQLLASHIIPPSASHQAAQHSTNTVTNTSSTPWTKRYGIQTMDSVVSPQNLQAAESLQQWIQQWCSLRQQAMQRMKQRQQTLSKKKQRKTVYKDESDLWMDSDDDESMAHRSLFLLTGPAASGKTSLVHAVAELAHCQVLEINTSASRNAAALKRTIQEATQSCSQLFQKKAAASSSTVVILLDEVDVLFTADAGFWTALTSVAKTAQCPIVLTAHSVPSAMTNLHYHHQILTRPTPFECATYIQYVCEQEGISFGPHTTMQSTLAALERVAILWECDLRRILWELECLVTAPPRPSSSSTLPLLDTTTQVTGPPMAGPTFTYLQPPFVPFDRYTIVTVHGFHLDQLGPDVVVRVGSIPCPTQVLSPLCLCFQCPPLSLGTKAISVETKMLPVSTKSIQLQAIVPGVTLPASRDLYLQVFPTPPGLEHVPAVTTPEQAVHHWNHFRGSVPCFPCGQRPKPLGSQTEDLESMVEALSLSSDAAFLEEGLEGVPFLSGACRGLEWSQENGRPPTAEQLWSLNEEQSSKIYGEPEAYLQRPTNARQRKEIRDWMNHARGTSVPLEPTGAVDKDTLDDTDVGVDWDHVRQEQDMFLSVPLSAAMEELPQLLRKTIESKEYVGTHRMDLDTLQVRRRHKQDQLHMRWVSSMFGPECTNLLPRQRGKTYSRELLLARTKDSLDPVVATDFLPMFSRIASTERAWESLQLQEVDPAATAGRRTTRRQAQTARFHYFDRISRTMELDKADLSSSELGHEMAESLLLY